MSAIAVHAVLLASLETCKDHEVEIGQLDAVAGDGDHGSGMVRGFTAACSATADLNGSTAGSITAAGYAFADAAGGASGALWGVFLRGIGRELGDGDVTPSRVVAALRSGGVQIGQLGKSQPGDKTLLDTLVPFLDALDGRVSRGMSLSQAWTDALAVAREATEATSLMVAKRGRSAVLGERSLGTVDPGARSLLLVLEAVASVIADIATRPM
jgi:dihydroxyacetone kinase